MVTSEQLRMVFLAHRLHSELYWNGTLPMRPSFVALLKNCNRYHLILPIFLPCFLFPLPLITSIQDTTIICLVYCLSPCLLVVPPNLFFLSSWAPGFPARNCIFLSPLWLGRTTWLRFRQRYMCNSDVWNFPVIFLKKLALDPSFPLAGWNLKTKCWGRQNCPTSLGP